MTRQAGADRPVLDHNIDAGEFVEFYWLKAELIAFCRAQGMQTSGSKQELAARISLFLASGGVVPTTVKPKRATTATNDAPFDWHSAALNPSTLITADYRNTQNVRRFFTAEIGDHFKFNVTMMAWMKNNAGKTLADAVVEWHRIRDTRSAPGFTPSIAPQFEYNAYIQAFTKANPDVSRADAIRCWKFRKSRRGHNRYEASDLQCLKP